MTLAEMLDKLERGRIGHTEAMQWLGVDSYTELVAIVHANGRQMPGHRPTPVPPETRALLRQIMRPVEHKARSSRAASRQKKRRPESAGI
jgi:hypothetical protein